MSDRDVVITGVGVVSPIGIGCDAYWDSMVEQRSGVRELTAFDPSTSQCKIAGEVLDFEPKKYIRPRKSLKVMSRDIQLGFAAADMAVTSSGLIPEDVDPEKKGVIFGADMIYTDVDALHDAYRSCLVDGKFDFSLWGTHAIANMHPLWMLKYLPNMTACHIGIFQDARGPNNSITIGDTSSLQALSEAVHVIQRAKIDVVISGGASSPINPTVHDFRGRGRFTRGDGDPTTFPRPFDRERDGTLLSEGAASFVLESREHAVSRGATILAQIASCSSCFEPITSGTPPRGTAIRMGIKTALEKAGLQPDDIDHVNAHGIATVEDDRVEAEVIAELLGEVPVIAPKSYFGNLGAGGGAVEMVASLLALNKGVLPASLNYKHPDPECPVNVIHSDTRRLDKKAALLLNQDRNGQAVATIITTS